MKQSLGKAKDITGEKFGRLTAIKRVGSNPKNRDAMWLCRCECGIEKIIRGERLRNGNTNKRDAKKRGHSFELTEEQFIRITKMDCYYCGTKPNNISKSSDCYGEYIYNGIDRIDSSKGYTFDNIVPCCKICNYAKHNLTLQEFQKWAKRLYNKMFGEEK